MRIDLLLHKLCLTKSRNIAKTACDKNLVYINGKIAKASQEVNVGDIVYLNLYGYHFELRLEKLPQGNISKQTVNQYYTLLKKEYWE